MGNKENLKLFTSENQPPAEKKSRKGIPNRATVFKKLLAMKIDVDHPQEAGEKLNITMHEAAALGVIKAAMAGNPVAFKEIQDTLYGKITDEQNLNVSGEVSLAVQAFREAAQKIYGDEAENNQG